MTKRFWKTSAGLVAFAALGGLVGATVAVGAGSAKKGTTTTTTATTTKTARPGHAGETPLTGDVLAKVNAAAVAKVGGTVDSATTENDGDDANAAYEAHVTKADGTHVTVILDKSYNVLAVETGHGPGGHDHGHPGTVPGTVRPSSPAIPRQRRRPPPSPRSAERPIAPAPRPTATTRMPPTRCTSRRPTARTSR